MPLIQFLFKGYVYAPLVSFCAVFMVSYNIFIYLHIFEGHKAQSYTINHRIKSAVDF